MASYNRIIMMGNLTRDPEHKQLPSGQTVCRLGIAANRQFKNKQTGSMTQEVCFIDVDVWGTQADSCQQYLSKGRSILVEGRLKLDSWQDNDGNRRSKHSIVADRVTFLSGAPDASTGEFDENASSSSNENDNLSASVETKTYKKRASNNKETTDILNGDKIKGTSGEIDFTDEKPFDDDLPF